MFDPQEKNIIKKIVKWVIGVWIFVLFVYPILIIAMVMIIGYFSGMRDFSRNMDPAWNNPPSVIGKN